LLPYLISLSCIGGDTADRQEIRTNLIGRMISSFRCREEYPPFWSASGSDTTDSLAVLCVAVNYFFCKVLRFLLFLYTKTIELKNINPGTIDRFIYSVKLSSRLYKMGFKTPLIPAIVSGIDSVLLHFQTALTHAQKIIDSVGK
jgi:hypothetical protein